MNNHRSIVVGAIVLLLASLAVTVVLDAAVGEQKVERVLFFPGTVSSDLSGERRVVRDYRSAERDLRALVEESILGPASIDSSAIFPAATTVDLFMLRDQVVYIDLSASALFPSSNVHLSARESLSALRHSLSFNFPQLRDIVITINGHLPFEPLFGGSLQEGREAASVSR